MVSKRLEKLMSGWGKNRKTTPLKNTLVNRSASQLTKNQIMFLLKNDPILMNRVQRAIEHRAKNIQNENFRRFMKNYYAKKTRRSIKK